MPTSFGLFTDSSLTTAYGGTTTLTHKSDLSDNPQDFVLYYGSTATGTQAQANSNPGVDNITLTPTQLLGAWAASTVYSLGDRRLPTVPSGYVQEVTAVSGSSTSGSSEPAFGTAIGSTVIDGDLTWTCISTQHELTEVKLATSSAGLDSATAGAALSLGTTVLSGTANKVEVHVRVTNAVTTVTSNSGAPEISFLRNSVIETAV